MPYVAQRSMTIAGTKYGPGEAVPGERIGRRQLTAAINLGRILYLPEGADLQYVTRRPILMNGRALEPGTVVDTQALTGQQLRAAVGAGHLVPQTMPAALAAPVPEVRRRGRPPRRVQAAPAVGSH